MFKVTVTIFLLIITCLSVKGQTISIIGKVVNDSTSVPLKNALVEISSNIEDKSRSYTDDNGRFLIRVDYSGVGLNLKISYENASGLFFIKKQQLKAAKYVCDVGVIKIFKGQFLLNEVEIKSVKRFSDTSRIDLTGNTYNKSVFADEIIGKQYGFVKDRLGNLFYNGESVQQITINGNDFFTSVNKNIFELLPAFTLNDIEIVRTNIDSLTNTNLLKPITKVNIRLKSKYDRGFLGNAAIGFGTLNRYVTSLEFYAYRPHQQFSTIINSNNLNLPAVPITVPVIGFTTSGNNSVLSSFKTNYRNSVSRKISFELSAKGTVSQQVTEFSSQIKDEVINRNLNSNSSSLQKAFNISESNFKTSYNISKRDLLIFNQSVNFGHRKNQDTTSTKIITDTIFNNSYLSKILNRNNLSFLTNVGYLRSTSKKGRSFSINYKYGFDKTTVTEFNFNSQYSNVGNSKNRVNFNKDLTQKTNMLVMSYNETIDDRTNVSSGLSFSSANVLYRPLFKSDTAKNYDIIPVGFTNYNFEGNIKFHKNVKKFDFNLTGAYQEFIRDTSGHTNTSILKTLIPLVDISTAFKLSDSKYFDFNYTTIVNYPTVNQLTNIDVTYDPFYSQIGNIFLKPEIKRSLDLTYNLKNQNSLIQTISTGLSRFENKFGYKNLILNIFSQSNTLTNVGNTNAYYITYTRAKSWTDSRSLNISTGFYYEEFPSLNVEESINVRSYSYKASASSMIGLIKNKLSLSPTLLVNFTRSKYLLSNQNFLSMIYTDKLSLKIFKSEINIFPIAHYTSGLISNSFFTANAEITKKLFKNYGCVWFQVYDLFNSFNYTNNIIGPTYSQSTTFNNLKRYFILGFSYKFNNMN